MGAVLHRLLQAVRFERDAFVWMDLNDRATGDAFLLVVATRLVLILVGTGFGLLGLAFNLLTVLFGLLNAVVGWLVYGAVTYFAAKQLFRGDGNFAVFLRMAGFAYPTLVLMIFTFWLIPYRPLALVTGALWFLAIMAYGTHYVADLSLDRAAASAGFGFVGLIIVDLILRGGLI